MFDVLSETKKLMQQNARAVDGYSFTVPSPDTYPYQWLWDSCFHAIILWHFDPEAAQKELSSLVVHQNKYGFIGHITYWESPRGIFDIKWTTERTSHITQPPMLAFAVWKVFSVTHDTVWLGDIYPSLKNYYSWLLQARCLDGIDLAGIVNPDESGEDSSPRFDAALGLPIQHDHATNTAARFALFEAHAGCDLNARCTKDTFWILDAPFNAILVKNLRMMTHIADQLSLDGDKLRWTKEATKVKQAMEQYLLEDCRFLSLDGKTNKRINVNTSSLFVALWAELYSHALGTQLIEKYLLDENKFWREAGIPTVAANEVSYDPTEPAGQEASDEPHPHWRGPIWMAHHWFIYHGLLAYGFQKQAAELREKSVRLVEQHGFREYFHPDTGVGMGAHNFTWGGLVIDME